jgi:uncharacterized OsmC-like protein
MTQATAAPTGADVRRYVVGGKSTDTFGRVLVSARDQHIIVDGPVANGCPGEAITPAEMFLSGVAGCGVELIQVLAKGGNVPLQSVAVRIEALQDRANPVRPDVSLFNTVNVDITLGGVSPAQAEELVSNFKKR